MQIQKKTGNAFQVVQYHTVIRMHSAKNMYIAS